MIRSGLALAFLVTSQAALGGDAGVGVAYPGSGPKAALGASIARAVRAEIERRNAADPTLGLRLIEADDSCSVEGGASSAGVLVAAKPAVVIGHPCSNAAIAAAKVYALAQVPYVAIGPRNGELTAKAAGPAVFRFGGRDDREAADTVAVFAPILYGVRIAVVHDRTQMSRGLAEAVMAGFKRAGITDILVEPIVAGERDYGWLVQKLKASGAGAIYFAGFPAEAALIFDGVRASGLVARFIGCSALSEMKRPWLSVMVPRRLDDEQVQAAVKRVMDAVEVQAKGGEAVSAALARQFDEEGDEAAPSFVPQPFPLE